MRMCDKFCRRTTIPFYIMINRRKYCGEVPERLVILYTCIHGMWWKATEIIKRNGETFLHTKDAVHVTDDGIFHRFLCQEICDSNMWQRFDGNLLFVCLKEILFLLHHLRMYIGCRMHHEQILVIFLHGKAQCRSCSCKTLFHIHLF